MARVCLLKEEIDSFIDAFRSGKVSLSELTRINSAARNAKFAQFLPEDKARLVNSRFEQAMLSKQRDAFRNWIENVTTPKDPIRREMLKRVEKMRNVLDTAETDSFLADLTDTKLGIKVTQEEAKKILILKNQVDDAAKFWDAKKAEEIAKTNPTDKNAGWKSPEHHMSYGYAVDDFKTYVGKLKSDAEAISFSERIATKNWGKDIIDTGGYSKSFIASVDDSFIGRQGIRTLWAGNYKQWGKSAVTSLELFGKELFAKSPKGMFKDRDDAIMRTLRAEIYGRPNAMNGKYKASRQGYGLGVLYEEAFPSALPEKLPFLGRLFKASNTAYTGTALKMRADLADAIIATNEKLGIDMLDEKQATAFGQIIMSQTGRAFLGRGESVARSLNNIFFSPRFLKSGFDVLTAHQFSTQMTKEAKELARKNLLKTVLHIGTVLGILKMMNPDAIELDPRSSQFGTIKIGDRRIDITGGMKGYVVLASRFLSYHDGEWGSWSKSNSGKWVRLNENVYGQNNLLDTFEQFFEGKLAPLPGVARDWMKGQHYGGDKPTIGSSVRQMTVPITFNSFLKDMEAGKDDALWAALAEGFGFSQSPDVLFLSGSKVDELKKKVGDERYTELVQKATDEYNKKRKVFENSARYERMTTQERNDELDKIRSDVKERLLRSR